jgi:hypothetical protein
LPVRDDEVRVMVAPWQKLAGPLMVGVAGVGLAVTSKGAEVAEQPLGSATVTV